MCITSWQAWLGRSGRIRARVTTAAMTKDFTSSFALSAASVLILSLATACPAGKAADVVKSDAPKVSKGPKEAGTDKISCDPEKNYDVLAVDWEPEARGDFEVAMKQGTVVVNFSCDGLVVLEDCTAEGGYGFIGMTRKEKVIQMKDSDEVKANLPLSGIKWLGDASVGMERGTSLDVAMMMIGKKKSARRTLASDELEGDCDGATHYVSAATLGAFVMASGTAAKLDGAATIMGRGLSGGSESAEAVRNKDGDVEACMSATSNSKTPPDQCGAVVRLKMKALKAGKALASKEDDGQDNDAVACPKGMVFADGACTKDTDQPHQCEPGEADACEKQCKAGDAASCSILGSMFWKGNGVDKDWEKSTAMHEKGCKAGSARSCRYAGRAYRTGQGADKDAKTAKGLLTSSCEAGDGLGCVELGQLFADNKDGDDAVGMFRKACYGGEYEGCSHIGLMYWSGKGGLRKSPKLAVKFFEKGCKEGSPLACTKLADAKKAGKGTKKDKDGAAELYKKTCNRGYEDACGK